MQKSHSVVVQPKAKKTGQAPTVDEAPKSPAVTGKR